MFPEQSGCAFPQAISAALGRETIVNGKQKALARGERRASNYNLKGSGRNVYMAAKTYTYLLEVLNPQMPH